MEDKIKQLNDNAKRLASLTEDPHPGLTTWWAALADVLHKINNFQEL